MPFQPGHPGYPAKIKAMHMRHVSMETRQRIPAKVYVDFHLAVAGRRPDIRVIENDQGELEVTWADSGVVPTLEQQRASMDWLANRQFGGVPSVVQLDHVMRGESGGDDELVGAIAERSSSLLLAMRDLLLANRVAESAEESRERVPLDVTSTEHDTSDTSEPAALPAAIDVG